LRLHAAAGEIVNKGSTHAVAVTLGRDAACIALLSCLVFALWTRFVFQSYEVDGRCMEPHLFTSERIVGEKISFLRRPPRRGDLVIFVPPGAPSELFIKRVIAVGGETIALRGGVCYVDGRWLPEPYLPRAAVYGGDFGPHRVAPGALFVLGDNRDASDDSRRFGDVPEAAIVARGALRYWPPTRGLQAF